MRHLSRNKSEAHPFDAMPYVVTYRSVSSGGRHVVARYSTLTEAHANAAELNAIVSRTEVYEVQRLEGRITVLPGS